MAVALTAHVLVGAGMVGSEDGAVCVQWATYTPVPPSDTPVPPTATEIPPTAAPPTETVGTPTDVPTFSASDTPVPATTVPPTATRTPSRTAVYGNGNPTATRTPTRTATPDLVQPVYGLQVLGPSTPEMIAVATMAPAIVRARVFWAPCCSGWGWSDSVVDWAEDNSYALILEWWMWQYDGESCDVSDVPIADYEAHAAAMAARYAGRVYAYELDNEPDESGCIDPLVYAARFDAAAGAIRQEDAAALVINGGLALDPTPDWAWLEDFLAAVTERPDALAVHHYDYWRTMASKLAGVRARWSGDVWITETGERSNAPTPGPYGQATVVAKLMRDCNTGDVQTCVVYRSADGDDPYLWGLYNATGTPKPAATSWAENR